MADANSATVKVTDSSFKADVLQSSEPVVVDLWAEWCGPCRMIAPALEEIAGEMKGKVKVAKLNIDENPDVTTQYGVQSIPTLLLFKDGKVASKKVGAAPKGELQRWISSAIRSIIGSSMKMPGFAPGIFFRRRDHSGAGLIHGPSRSILPHARNLPDGRF